MRAFLLVLALVGLLTSPLDADGTNPPILFRIVTSSCTNPNSLTPKEQVALEGQVAAGDGEAAWKIYMFANFSSGQQEKARFWLKRSAELGWPDAERWQAYEIKNGARWNFDCFGKTRPDAVYNLYLRAAKKHAFGACEELAECYEKGYGGHHDLTSARHWYVEGAQNGGDLTCWPKAAEYLYEGKGGPRNIEEAYFWISAETLCFDTRSVGGKESLVIRERYEKSLSLQQLEAIWKRLDVFIAQVWSGRIKMDTPPFLKGEIKKAESDDSRVYTKQFEKAHRLEVESRLNSPAGKSQW